MVVRKHVADFQRPATNRRKNRQSSQELFVEEDVAGQLIHRLPPTFRQHLLDIILAMSAVRTNVVLGDPPRPGHCSERSHGNRSHGSPRQAHTLALNGAVELVVPEAGECLRQPAKVAQSRHDLVDVEQ